MKTIQDAADQAQTSLQKGVKAHSPAMEIPSPGLDERLVDQLFVRLNSIYGHLWSSRFRSQRMLAAAKGEWGRKLAGYSPSDIGFAIDQCVRFYRDAPPNLPQFLCMLPTHEPMYQEFKRLPVLKSDEATAKPHRDRLRKLVGLG